MGVGLLAGLNEIYWVFRTFLQGEGTLRGAAEYADRYNLQLNLASSAQLFHVTSSLTSWLLVFLPAGITWGWIFRTWQIRKRPGIASLLWILLTSIGFIFLIYFIAPGILSSPVEILSYLLACTTGVVIGYLSGQKAEGFPYPFTDWAGYAMLSPWWV